MSLDKRSKLMIVGWSMLGLIMVCVFICVWTYGSSRKHDGEVQSFDWVVDDIVSGALPGAERAIYGQRLEDFIYAGIDKKDRNRDDGYQWILAAHRADVFMCKIVYPKSPNRELFPCASNFGEELRVAWVHSELTGDEAKKQVKDFKLEVSDCCYAYSAPGYAWDNMCGEAGMLVVRSNRIVYIQVEVVN